MAGSVHFEIHINDTDAGQAFYSGLLGWRFEQMPGGEAVGYHTISGSGVGTDGALTGGMLKRPGSGPRPGDPIRGANLVFEVEDVDASYAWAIANGGAEALPPEDYENVGRVAYCEDGQGNVVGLITPVRGGN